MLLVLRVLSYLLLKALFKPLPFSSHTRLIPCLHAPWTCCHPPGALWHCRLGADPGFVTAPQALPGVWSKILLWTSGSGLAPFQTDWLQALSTDFLWAVWLTAVDVLHSVFLPCRSPGSRFIPHTYRISTDWWQSPMREANMLVRGIWGEIHCHIGQESELRKGRVSSRTGLWYEIYGKEKYFCSMTNYFLLHVIFSFLQVFLIWLGSLGGGPDNILLFP